MRHFHSHVWNTILNRFSLKLNEIIVTKAENEALNINSNVEYIKYIIEGFGNSTNLLEIKLSITTIRKPYNI